MRGIGRDGGGGEEGLLRKTEAATGDGGGESRENSGWKLQTQTNSGIDKIRYK